MIPSGSCLNNPRPYELLYSICSNCMGTNDCIYELIDNSIDAGANKIKISYEITDADKNLMVIRVSDNGKGMNLDELSEALVLGSRVNRNKGSLGHFGVGLIVSAFNLGRELKVYSRTKDSPAKYSSLSLEEMKRTDKWVKNYGSVLDEDLELFDSYVGETGTLVEISLNRELPKNLISVIKNLPEDLARKYYKLLNGNISIDVLVDNQYKSIDKGIDPFNEAASKVIFDQEVSLPVVIPGENKKEVPIKVKGYLLKEDNPGNLPISLSNQGIFVYRNGREIYKGGFMGIICQHNDFNRFRIDLSIDEQGQEAIKIASNKTNASFACLDAKEEFRKFLTPHLEKVRNEVNSNQKIIHPSKKRLELERKLKNLFREATLDLIEVETIKEVNEAGEEAKESSTRKKTKAKSNSKRFPSGKGFVIKFVIISSEESYPYSCCLENNTLTIKLNQNNKVVHHNLSSISSEEAYKKAILLDFISFYSNESLDYSSFVENKNKLEGKITK